MCTAFRSKMCILMLLLMLTSYSPQYAPRQRAYTWGSCAPRAAAPCDRQTDGQTDGRVAVSLNAFYGGA